MPLKSKSIRQTVTLPCTPKQAYDLLMVSRLHAAFTGDKAKVSTKLGGRVESYSGYVEACNLELKPGKRIVQAWRTSEWPAGWFSKATFTFTKVKGGTKLSFSQSHVPANKWEALKVGWIEHYWERMKEHLEK